MRSLTRTRGRRLVLAVAAMLTIFMLTTAESCEEKQVAQRRHSIENRAQAFDRAERAVPVPKTVNFPLRRALAEFTARQDLIDHPWYVYILADTGNIIGYYVAKTVPVNACDFLSSTEDIDNGAVLTAPSLDGIFYGGSGSTSGCDAWFFFDSATNALVQIRGVNWFSSDQPLRVEASPIRVKGK